MKACRFTERLQQAISISGLIEIYSELNRKGSRFLKNDTGLVKLEIFKPPGLTLALKNKGLRPGNPVPVPGYLVHNRDTQAAKKRRRN